MLDPACGPGFVASAIQQSRQCGFAVCFGSVCILTRSGWVCSLPTRSMTDNIAPAPETSFLPPAGRVRLVVASNFLPTFWIIELADSVLMFLLARSWNLVHLNRKQSCSESLKNPSCPCPASPRGPAPNAPWSDAQWQKNLHCGPGLTLASFYTPQPLWHFVYYFLKVPASQW